MNKLENELNGGEVLYKGNPKWYHLKFKSIVVWLVLFLLMTISSGEISFGFIIFFSLICFKNFIKSKNDRLIITEDIVVYRKGILRKSLNEVFIEDIRNIEVKQNLFERVFGFGNLTVSSPATSGKEIVLKSFPKVEDVKNIIQRERRRMKNNKN